jgi:FlgD Ig-like domain
VPSSILVRVAFGLLVVATVGAFFVTQRVKRSTPVVQRVFFPKYVSPNGDGRKDTVPMRFDLPESDRVTVTVVNEAGDDVRTLADDRFLRKGGPHTFTWDGRTDDGVVVPDGRYRLRVTLRSEGRAVTAPRELLVDTTPPRPRLVAATPPTIVPGLAGPRGRVRLRYQGESDTGRAGQGPLFQVWRTDRPQNGPVAAFNGPRFRQTAEWDGLVNGRPAPDGVYAFSVTVQDKAGNRGSFPTLLPPTRESAARRTGVSVRYLALKGPLEPVRAGAIARFEVGPLARRSRWNLTRVGQGRLLNRGQGRGTSVAVRVPRDASNGLYLVRVQAGGHRAIWPLAVRGRQSGSVLVVLPSITWQGLNPVDDDRDGFPDTLDTSSAVDLGRPLAYGRLPAGFVHQVVPFMRFLDRKRLRYELTTDLALARAGADPFGGHSGIAFPGGERWLTEELDIELRKFVEDGGRVASFGPDAFKRRLTVSPPRLAEPSPPEAVNVFGERTDDYAEEPAPMVVTRDRVGLFAGTDGFIGLFSRFERSGGLVHGTRVLAAAGREDARPAFIAYRLGGGIVMRAGSPDWSASINGAPEVGEVTERIWSFLSR